MKLQTLQVWIVKYKLHTREQLVYSQTYIKSSPLEQSISGLFRRVTS